MYIYIYSTLVLSFFLCVNCLFTAFFLFRKLWFLSLVFFCFCFFFVLLFYFFIFVFSGFMKRISRISRISKFIEFLK